MTHTSYEPLRGWTVAARLAGGGLALAMLLCLIGWSIVSLAPASWTTAETNVNDWFVDQRTDVLNTLTHVGSYLSDTPTCIAVLMISVIVFRLWL